MDRESVILQNWEALGATLNFGAKALVQPEWLPGALSEAAVELANGEVGQNGPWGPRPVQTTYATANLMMRGVLDDLVSLQRLLGGQAPMLDIALGGQVPVIGPTVVARSAVEIASTVWWLMEPGIGARRRVCRQLVLDLTSARRAVQVANDMEKNAGTSISKEVAKAVADTRAQETGLLQRIADMGLAQPTSGTSPAIEGEKAPTATSATADMLRPVLSVNDSKEAVYRVYSAVTHGEIYALMSFTGPGVSSNGEPVIHWRLDQDVLDSTIQLAICAFREAYRRVQRVMGRGKLEADLWENKLVKIFSGA